MEVFLQADDMKGKAGAILLISHIIIRILEYDSKRHLARNVLSMYRHNK